jgi:hypothetical protein
MKKLQHALLFFSLFVFASAAWPDTLELKNGSTIVGTYMGGSETEISFRVGSSIQRYNVADVRSLKFSSSDSSRSEDSSGFASRPDQERRYDSRNEPYQPARSSQSYSNTITIPTGTRLTVRTIDQIDSDKNHVGDKFGATLERDLYVNDVLVAPKGADVYGRLDESKEAGHISGKSELKLSLTGIVINGRTFALSTGDYEVAGKSRGANTAKKVGGGAALGAVIGAIAGGGKGAAIGAGVGAGAGTAVQVMTRGQQVHVPSETLLEFTLAEPVTVTTR